MQQDTLFDPQADDFRADPYRYYRRLRERAPVHHHPAGYWLLTRYRDCAAVLEDRRWRNVEDYGCLPEAAGARSARGRMAAPGSAPAAPEPAPAAPEPEAAAPGNGEVRYRDLQRTVARALSPAVVERLQPRIRTLVGDVVERALAAGEVDVVETLAYPLATVVFCELFGVPPGDRATFRGWVDDIVRGVDALLGISDEERARRDRARTEFHAYFRDLVAARRRDPRDDLLSGLVRHYASAERDEELIGICVLVLIAGHESTANLVGNGLLALLQHPGELRRLRADPGLVAPAVEEFLRYDSPAQFAVRAAREPVEVGGARIPAGDVALVFLAAANRDPEVFADPDLLVLDRPDNRHLSFGRGSHACLGAYLARAEARVAFETLMRRSAAIELAGEPVHKRTLELRGLARLPVRLR